MNDGDKEFGLGKTYEMAPNVPPPVKWEEYERRVMAEWNTLLNSEAGCIERNIHAFLVKHPSMVPGPFSMTGRSGHGPFPMAVLSESPLSGIGMKVPDFIWLAQDSATFSPVFVEIESPCKRWFTNKEVPTSELTQAVNQLAQWRAWLNQAANVNVFYDSFEIPSHMRRWRTFRPEFVLIYGRRQEFDERPHLNRLRDQFEHKGQVVMTFDRLRPEQDAGGCISATKRNGSYRALAVPATMRLGPNSTASLEHVSGIADAILRNEWISEERKRFLVQRLPYWIEWEKRPHHGIIASNDFE